MTKRDFLNRLEEALLEQMDISEAAPHIRYYQDYIENEVRNGRDEEEVVASLTNPRLIAKNLVTNSKSANKYKSDIYEEKSQTGGYNYSGYDNQNKRPTVSFSINGKPINSLLAKIVLAVVAILAIVLVIAIISGVMWLLMKIVLPVVFIVGIVYLLVNVIRKSL